MEVGVEVMGQGMVMVGLVCIITLVIVVRMGMMRVGDRYLMGWCV
jgi:hypothetical protein